MTLHATRHEDASGRGMITVHGTYGPTSYEITEEAAHIGHFWHQLGELLQEHEKPVSYVKNVELPE